MAQKPKYKVTIDDMYSDGEELGWDKTAFTNKPAIIIKGVALTAQDRPVEMFFADKLKYQIAAPLMIPMEIYRNDSYGEYYVEFTEAEIERIHKKKMSKLTTNKGLFNLEHDNGEIVPAYLLEMWIVDKPEQDKSFSTYGVKVPKGTLFGVAQVTDKEYYANLVANEQTGFSIEGFLGLTLQDIEESKKKTKKTKETKMEENTILPEGAKFQIEDKWYEVKDGKVVEVIEAEKEVAASEEAPVEDKKEEEVEMAEAPSEEKKKEEVEMAEVPVEEVPVEEVPVIETYTKEEVDAKFDEIYKMLAELKEEEIIDEVDEMPVAMSVHERFAAFNRFARKK